MCTEAFYAVTHEDAIHLDNVLECRLRVSMEYAYRGVDSARAATGLAVLVLGWSRETMRRGIKVFVEHVETILAAEHELIDKAVNETASHAVETRIGVGASLDH